MADILKAKTSIYLINAYSNLNPKIDFISGSDRVGIKLIEHDFGEVVVVAPSIFKKFLPEGIKFYSSDNLRIGNLFFRYFYRTFKTIFILRELIKINRKKSQDFRIISTSDFFPDVIPSFIYSNKLKWYAFTFHLYPFDLAPRNFLGRFLQILSFIMFKNTYKVVTTSSENENFLKKNFHLQNILKIPLGIDDIYPQIKKKNRYNLVYLGRIKQSKGVYDLPDIIKKLIKDFPKIKLFIIGNGADSDLKRLTFEIKKKNLQKNIKIMQNLNDSEVKELLLTSKVLLQPSYEEGFGLSVLEALVFELKVVLYNLPIYHEHFSDFDLDYVEIGNKSEFSSKIKSILLNKEEVIYSKDLFTKFSWSQIFDKIFKDK